VARKNYHKISHHRDFVGEKGLYLLRVLFIVGVAADTKAKSGNNRTKWAV